MEAREVASKSTFCKLLATAILTPSTIGFELAGSVVKVGGIELEVGAGELAL